MGSYHIHLFCNQYYYCTRYYIGEFLLQNKCLHVEVIYTLQHSFTGILLVIIAFRR